MFSRLRRNVGKTGFAHKGRKLAAGLAAAAVALMIGVAAVPNAAEASIIKTVDLGTLPIGADGLYLNGKISASNNPTANGYYTLDFGTSGPLTAGSTSGSVKDSISYIYNFTLAQATSVVVNLSSSSNLNLTPASFLLYSAGGALKATSVFSTTQPGSLQIGAALLGAGSYYFQVNTAYVKNSSVNGVGNLSAVPLPGALVLFGSGLVGLAAFARGRKKTAAIA